MKKKMSALLIVLMISTTFLVLIPQSSAADIRGPDLIVNTCTVTSIGAWRHLQYTVKNIGNAPAYASWESPFYCDIYLQVWYHNDETGENWLTTPIYKTRQGFITTLYPEQESLVHHYWEYIENNEPELYSYRFCVYADSTDKFPNENNNNWGFSNWF